MPYEKQAAAYKCCPGLMLSRWHMPWHAQLVNNKMEGISMDQDMRKLPYPMSGIIIKYGMRGVHPQRCHALEVFQADKGGCIACST